MSSHQHDTNKPCSEERRIWSFEQLEGIPEAGGPIRRLLSFPPQYLLLTIFIVIAAMIPFYGSTASLRTLSVTFISIVLEALPFMLLGSLVGGVIEVFVSNERMAALLPRNRRNAVILAASLGMIFPVCECAVVPVVRRLTRKGFPVSAAVAYLLGAPIFNPIVATSTAVAYKGDLMVVACRLIGGFIVAVAVGLIVDKILPGQTALLPQKPDDKEHGQHYHSHEKDDHCHHGKNEHHEEDEGMENTETCSCCHHEGEGHGEKKSFFAHGSNVIRHASDDFMAVGHYLIIGAFVAAVAQTYIERQTFVRFADMPLIPILSMMALAVCLNLCSEADAFVSASFRGLMPLSAQMAFMILGPLLDIKLLLMYRALFSKRAIVILAVLIPVLTLLITLAMLFIGVL